MFQFLIQISAYVFELIKLCERLLGKSLDLLNPSTRHSIVLVSLLAWIGLGTDGLSSSCYSPEKTFLALSTTLIWVAISR